MTQSESEPEDPDETPYELSEWDEMRSSYQEWEPSQEDRLDFDGKITRKGLAISVTALGGAVLYALGIIIGIAILIAMVASIFVYLHHKYR